MSSSTNNSTTCASEQMLKNESREFCLDSIFCLDFSCKGLTSLGCIPKCLNLCVLDLSCNQLSGVDELSGLVHLEQLNLNDNQISALGGLDKLDNLSKLQVAGNHISTLDSLLPLSALVNLSNLVLQIVLYTTTPPLRLSNPVCQNPDYHMTMCEHFPNLRWLDGELVEASEPGATFYQEVRGIMVAQHQGSTCCSSTSREDMENGSTKLALPDDLHDNQDDAISGLLADCKESSSKIQQCLDHIKADLK